MLEREDQHMVLEYHRRPDHYTLNTSASYFDRHFQTVGTRGRALPLALHNPHALYPDPKTEARGTYRAAGLSTFGLEARR